MNKLYLYIGAGVIVLVAVFVAMYIFRPTATVTPVTTTADFGTSDDRPANVPGTPGTAADVPITSNNGSTSNSKIVKLLDGPIAGAALLEFGRPTTTLARFVLADSGRVFDLPLDVPGAVPRAVSNTTIPGIVHVVWTAGDSQKGMLGDGALLEYLTQNTVKTLHLAFPAATTTLGTQGAVKLKFLPDGIQSIAASPDGKAVSYVLTTSNGVDGYRSLPDGTAGKKLFSLPLTQLLLSWPAPGTLLAQTPAAAGVAGVVFSINSASGAAEPLVYANGLTATADPSFARVIYQSAEAGSRSTYAKNVKTGVNTPLSFDPLPERCVWATSTLMYCAAPLTYVGPNYLDLWHAGVATAADSIFSFDTATGQTHIVASPGGTDGGEQADIAQLAVSADQHYLLYIRKGDRSLWAVRLTQ